MDSVRSATLSAVSIRQNLDRYLELSDSIPEKAQLTQLKAQLQDLEKRKDQLGILDLKGKKEVGSAIKVTELKIADMSKIIALKDAPFLEQIQADRQRLLYTQAVAFGCKDVVMSMRNGNAFSYQYAANDIPQELMIGMSINMAECIPEDEKQEKTPKKHIEQRLAPLFCRKCGYKLLPDSTFCTKCGTRV